jgi:hypothetical protein
MPRAKTYRIQRLTRRSYLTHNHLRACQEPWRIPRKWICIEDGVNFISNVGYMYVCVCVCVITYYYISSVISYVVYGAIYKRRSDSFCFAFGFVKSTRSGLI